ncbi:MAG: M23 family metallopeptidase [Anaerolineae bacterium]|nr:M23 family metallopeptidase [Anaerolineae bacterium]
MSDFRFEVWPTEFRSINQYFGANPQNYAQFGLPGHEGLDIMAPTGSRIFAVAPGRVSKVDTVASNHPYGNYVHVDHRDGYTTIYAHLESISVRLGQEVSAGTEVGRADNTGNSFGSHLHLTLRKTGAKVGNWPAGIIDPTPFILPLMGWQEPSGPFTNGWAYSAGIFASGNLAQASAGGLNLRAQPSVNAQNVAFVPSGTIMIVTGSSQGQYTPVKVPTRSVDLKGSPPAGPTPTVPTTPTTPVTPTPIPPTSPDSPTVDGWAFTTYLSGSGGQVVVGQYGINLRAAAQRDATNIGLVRGGATVTIVGAVKGEYTPIRAQKRDFTGATNFAAAPTLGPAPTSPTAPPEPQTPAHTTAGWAFTTQATISGSKAIAGQYGINLRAQPRRDGQNLGFVPANTEMAITGAPQGEYTPVYVSNSYLQPPYQAVSFAISFSMGQDVVPDPDPPMFSTARIGLHTSLEGGPILAEEFIELAELRPGIIKILSTHEPDSVSRLAEQHPDAEWIVRPYVSFSDKPISPARFVEESIIATLDVLEPLADKQVVIELHSEPNLSTHGLYTSWENGAEFADWWLELLDHYRRELPHLPIIFPGLSPGSAIMGRKQDHIAFIEGARPAVEKANGLGVHLYWSRVSPMNQALMTLDDYISRFRFNNIWITQAGNTQPKLSPVRKGNEYLKFWEEVQKRATVHGITYLVSSTSDPKLLDMAWVGRGIGRVVGRR